MKNKNNDWQKRQDQNLPLHEYRENQMVEDMAIQNMKVRYGWHVARWVLLRLLTLSYVLNVKNSLSILQKMNIQKNVSYAKSSLPENINTVCLTLWSRIRKQENLEQ